MGAPALFDELPVQVSLADQITCVAREISYRRRVYPRLVELGKMSQETADEQIALMQAIEKTLRGLYR